MRPADRKLIHPSAMTTQAAEAAPPASQSHERPGVLVVDDEHFVRSMLQLGLESNGFAVWLAASGREAVDLYLQHRDRIAVVLLDVRMPGLDGPGTLNALRALNPDVLACFMTGDTGAYDPQELLQRGAARVIRKPFHLDPLANALRLLVHGGPAAEGNRGGARPL